MKINSITIVGGGTSGWMTAAALLYKIPNINVTLIESKEIGTIGVGESTLLGINRYLKLLDLEDQDWMPYCNATYKTSIQFTDFLEKGKKFQYPFGNNFFGGINYYDYFFTKGYDKQCLSNEDFGRIFSISAVLAEENKILDKYLPENSYNFIRDTAYHFDAILFSKFLKEKFCSKINHIVDEVIEVKVNEEGIQFLKLKKNINIINSDLYVDCTGFESLLLEKSLGVKYIPFGSLINDRSITARIPYKTETEKMNLPNVTDCKAMNSGWIWRIPLWERMGSGYVYSSNFISDEEAEKEFRKELNWNGEVKQVNFKHGYHEKVFYKNCIAIGLSYGFIEPLESTGLLTTHVNITRFIDTLDIRDNVINSIDKDSLNYAMEDMIKNQSDFVALHYALSKRSDTDYWKFVTDNVNYDINANDPRLKNSLIKNFLLEQGAKKHYNTTEGLLYILAGMEYNYLNKNRIEVEDKIIFGKVNEENITEKITNFKNKFKEIIEINKKLIDSAPTHYEYLKENIYKDKNENKNSIFTCGK